MVGCGKTDDGNKKDDTSNEKTEKVEFVKVDKAVPIEENKLTGLNIAYLGSSVMEGTENDGVSFVEFIAKRNNGTYVKETKADSTMADTGEDSYVQRIQKMDKNTKIDIFMCEIPFADVEQNVTRGEIDETKGPDNRESLEDFDTTTTAGAMEYIANYVRQTWDCPVIFFTNIKNGNKDYQELVQLGWRMLVKWQTGMVDAWFQLNTDVDEFGDYMVDETHPSGKGYLEWIAPFIESKLPDELHDYEMSLINELPEYALNAVAANEPNILTGKHVIYLGSSVTYGASSNQLSFVEYIAKRNDMTYTKEAVSGTTLVDNGDISYVQRMKNNIDVNETADLFVCQLSTNDATQKMPMGNISDSTELDDFDTTTVIGAMEYIICYAKQTWNCPVMFYTGTKYDSEQYAEMVEALKRLQTKYGIGIINMWDNLDIDIPQYDEYMADGVHPNRAGYLNWWTPYMERCMIEYLSQQ
jgi:lysophospholipase L1-like esterase